MAERRGTDVAEVLGWLGRCAVVTAAADALEDESSEAVLGRLAKIGVEGGGWDEIGLGAITDIVQQSYGPVAFDRSLGGTGDASDPVSVGVDSLCGGPAACSWT